MARIAGVTIPKDKRIVIALTGIYGIGRTRSEKVLNECNISHDMRVKDLAETEINAIREKIEKGFRVEGELRRDMLSNIKRLKEISSYRGTRHQKGLPSRGQRTKTNSRTVRGNTRKTMGSGKRAVTKT